MSCFRSIFFFNPFAQLFYKALTRERELACDDGVLELGFAAEQYAEALFCLEKFRQIQPDFSLAADGNKPWLLMERICRLLGKPARRKNKFSPLIFFSLITAVVLLGMQPKKLKKNEISNQAASIQVPVFPAEYETELRNINQMEKGIVIKPSFHRKQLKKPRVRPELPQSIPENESLTESQDAVQAVYAENKIERDYSNQLATVTNQAPILSTPGTPYLPSVTLSYQAVPEIISQDSLMNLAMLNGLQDLITANRIKTIARLLAVESEIEKNRNEIKEIESKNRKFILLDHKKLNPLLEEINHQIRVKRQKVNNLKLRLQHSEEEIIHI